MCSQLLPTVNLYFYNHAESWPHSQGMLFCLHSFCPTFLLILLYLQFFCWVTDRKSWVRCNMKSYFLKSQVTDSYYDCFLMNNALQWLKGRKCHIFHLFIKNILLGQFCGKEKTGERYAMVSILWGESQHGINTSVAIV